jgi:hypothetical protein
LAGTSGYRRGRGGRQAAQIPNQRCPDHILDRANHWFVDASSFYRVGDRLHTNRTRVIVAYFADRHGALIARY